MKQSNATLFYIGTLISSVGSMAFNICLVAFMVRDGWGLFDASLILGLQRLVPIVVSTLIGHLTDRMPPRLTVVATELGAAITSAGILVTWPYGKSAYWMILALCLARSCIVAFQAGSRAKITKLLSDDSYASNSKNAIWFNKATQGATLFAGLCAWPMIQYLHFEAAVWFDMLTFIANGAILLLISIKETEKKVGPGEESIFTKFIDFYRYNKRTAVLDLLLAISMMGTVSLMSRLAGNDQRWSALLMAGYGFSVWVAGYIERAQLLKNISKLIWMGLGTSYILLGMHPEQGWLTLSLAICKDTCYWLLLHRISTYIQLETPQNVMGAVSSARMAQMISVLAIGEIVVGSWQKFVPVFYDGLWRGLFCIAIVAALAMPQLQVEVRDGQPEI